jgi:hypothetical protein
MKSILFAATTMALSVAALQDGLPPPGAALAAPLSALAIISSIKTHNLKTKKVNEPIRFAKPQSPEAFAP